SRFQQTFLCINRSFMWVTFRHNTDSVQYLEASGQHPLFSEQLLLFKMDISYAFTISKQHNANSGQ
ncbi:hypothetical protein ACWE42_18785, partial [Sutcliffiella cohnii]